MLSDSEHDSGAAAKHFPGMRFDRPDERGAAHRVGIGIDFGTTNSAAAVFDGEHVTVVRLEDDSAIMQSASYIDTEFKVRTGNDAIRTYIDSNRGRRVEFRAEVLGEGRTSTGQIDTDTGLPSAADTETIYGHEFDDAGLPGRLFHGIKRLLGSRDSERVVIFRRPFRLVALITPILLRIRRTIEATVESIVGARLAAAGASGTPGTRGAAGARAQPFGSPAAGAERPAADHACIGYPVRFEGSDPGSDRRALDRLAEAYRHAGVVRQTFAPEPIAAAISYLYSHAPAGTTRVLEVDFGGGTLDMCVIRYRDAKLEVEAVHGIGLGGNKIDQAIFRELLFPLLGKGGNWRRVVEGRTIESEFPFWLYEERLLNWQVTYTLNQNKYTTPLLDLMRSGGPEAKPYERLYHLIAQNYGYETFRAIRALKERLSVDEAGVLDIPEIDVHVSLTRDEFERMIADEIRRFGETIDQTLEQAGLGESDIDIVLRTGGSALIPAFANILRARFPGKVVEQDPFTSVAAGLAIADYHGFGREAPVR